TFRSGQGGHLNVFADTLRLSDGGQISSGSTIARTGLIPSGAGGAITIQGLAGPTGSVVIDGTGSGIFTETQGTGAGGNINLSARSLTINNGGTLSAGTSGTAPTAIGGTITVDGNQMQLSNGATISANSRGPANAGNISVSASDSLVMQNHSSITT